MTDSETVIESISEYNLFSLFGQTTEKSKRQTQRPEPLMHSFPVRAARTLQATGEPGFLSLGCLEDLREESHEGRCPRYVMSWFAS